MQKAAAFIQSYMNNNHIYELTWVSVPYLHLKYRCPLWVFLPKLNSESSVQCPCISIPRSSVWSPRPGVMISNLNRFLFLFENFFSQNRIFQNFYSTWLFFIQYFSSFNAYFFSFFLVFCLVFSFSFFFLIRIFLCKDFSIKNSKVII